VAEPIAVEDFKNSDIISQRKENDRVERERRAERHAELLQKYHGEEGLKREKIAVMRGTREHVGIIKLFFGVSAGWHDYLGRVIVAKEKKRQGATKSELKHMDRKEDAIQKKWEAASARCGLAFSLFDGTAATPEIVARAKVAEKILTQYFDPETWLPVRGLSKKELEELDRTNEKLLSALKKLPERSQEELQREIDACQEEGLLLGR